MSSEARFCNLPELAEQSVLLFKFYINSRVSEGLGSGPRFCDLADLADGFPPSSSWIHVTIEFHDERLRKANENRRKANKNLKKQMTTQEKQMRT